MEITSRYEEVELSLVDRDPNQPREEFNDDDLLKLGVSIQQNTLLQAVALRPHPTVPGRFMIVAGERRFRAMRIAGTTKAVFKIYGGKDLAKSYILSAIENLQRVNLNPIEEAKCFQRLHDEEHLTWEGVSEMTNRDIAVILTKVKLLTLPAPIQELVQKGKLPQVRALNLAQHQNEEGDYLRLAHDLIAGVDTAEAHFRKQTIRGERQVKARLPQTPDEYARRLVKLFGAVQSMPAVLEAFMKLPSEHQKMTFEAIHPSVLGKLRVQLTSLYRATQALSERVNAYDSHRTGRIPVSDQPAVTTHVETHERPAPPPPPRPVTAAPVPNPQSVETAPPPQRFSPPPRPLPPTSKPETTFSPGGNGHDADNGATQSWDLSTRILAALFYSGGRRKVNLSRSELEKVVLKFLPANADIDAVVTKALQSAKAKWRTPPTAKGSDTERHFTRLITQFRRDYGDPKEFDDALTRAIKDDRSGDPVLVD